MGGEFREIVPPERLVFTATAFHDAQGNPAFENLNTVIFEDLNGKTKFTLTVYVRHLEKTVSPQVVAALRGMNQGWSESLDRLEELFTRASSTASTADREIVTSRIFDAPRELVFEAWTNPRHVENWWGPHGFTTTIQQMDVRPGGIWRLVMRGPDGKDYNNKIVFLEVLKPERLVYKHDPEKGTEPVKFEVTVTFDNRGGKTEVVMRMVFPSAVAREHVVQKYGAIEGAKQTLGRLAEYLRDMEGRSNHSLEESGEPVFVITRTFDARRDLVFKALTESERLARWWGPKGFTWVSATLDLRSGGVFHYCMRAPTGQEMWGKFVYREIVAPQKLVYINSFADEQGNTIRAPFSVDWPIEVLNTLTLAEHEGKTTLTLRGRPINATAGERKTFQNAFNSLQQGFTGTLDQLAEYLENG
jgi:uncharacterized protein YndB with AHSA1/START domain